MDEEQKLTAAAVLRRARPGDEAGILECIRALATYEREPEAVETTADALRQSLFGPSPSVFAHVITRHERIIGIAVWFLNYSTWTGRAGIYLEDLFVYSDERAAATARRCCGRWRSCAPSAATDGSSGPSSTGTGPPSASTAPLAPSAWTSGPSSASAATR